VNYTQEEINKRYEKTLTNFIDRFQRLLEIQNKKFGIKQGLVVMMIRDPSPGNVDISHNFNKIEDLITIYELSLESLRKQLKTTKTNEDENET